MSGAPTTSSDWRALRELKVFLRGSPPNLPFQIDAKSLALGSNFTFSTPEGDLDLLGWVEPLGGYEEIAPNAEEFPVDDLVFRAISLDDLIRVKQHIRRPRDEDALRQLLAIKRARGEEQRGG